jgi:DNA-directed RNA polymerase specialized sigma24 family protein
VNRLRPRPVRVDGDQLRTSDHERERDPLGYDLARYADAVTRQAENLRSAIYKAHAEGWSDLAIADRAGITIDAVQTTITRIKTLEQELYR